MTIGVEHIKLLERAANSREGQGSELSHLHSIIEAPEPEVHMILFSLSEATRKLIERPLVFGGLEEDHQRAWDD